MKEKLLFLVVLLSFFLSGCAGFVASDINRAMEVRRASAVDAKKAFDESKVVYVKDLRCYAYRDKDSKNDIDSLLFDAAGKKISNRGEAIEYVKFHYAEKDFSTGEKIALYSTMVWVGPVGFVFGVAENVAMLPAYPYVLHLKHKFEKETVENYQEGRRLYKAGQYSEAREQYFLALSGSRSLLYDSDIAYRIAVTYDKEGNTVLARKYYREFLDYSVALYPDYFQERDPRLTNDRSLLDREFTTAETGIHGELVSRQSPSP